MDDKNRGFWWHRRSLVWVALMALILFTFSMMFFSPEKITSLMPVYNIFAPGVLTILAGYFGVKMSENKKKIEVEGKEES